MIPFWHLPSADPDATAIVDVKTGTTTSYGELEARCVAWQAKLAGLSLKLGLLHFEPSAEMIGAYLALLRLEIPFAIASAKSRAGGAFVERFAPDFLIAEVPSSGAFEPCTAIGDARLFRRSGAVANAGCHPKLGLIMFTSGSTGAAKAARISRDSLAANARSIVEALNLQPGERAALSVPPPYAYGLSILNSHLTCGAGVVRLDHPITSAAFWSALRACGCTSLAGVPYAYEWCLRANLLSALPATVRTLTQAGGRLAPPEVERLWRTMSARGGRVVLMYGQTEATARISYVPPERLPDKVDTVGIAIPGGRIGLRPHGASGLNEVVYRGPNVMMGYASSRSDLARGDDLGGVLPTGDLGAIDDEGFLRITGRLSRFAKVCGMRLDLGEAEAAMERELETPVIATEQAGRLSLTCEAGGRLSTEPEIERHAARYFGLPRDALRILVVAGLPRTESGKKCYAAA